MEPTSRARRRAVAVAAGSLLLLASGRADAAAPPVLEYEAAAAGMALHIEINMPQPVVLPGLGDVTTITQDISITSGSTSKDASSVTAVAKAVLGNGNIVALSDLLGLEVESSLGGQATDSDALAAEDLGLINVGVGEITTSVAPDSATTTLTSAATSMLASLRVGLGDAESDLVELSLLGSSTNVTRAGSMVTAKATAEVGGLSILGGLVTINAIKSESVSSANGVAGAAASDTLMTIVGLKVADVLELTVTPSGVQGTVLGNAMPPGTGDALGTVITQVNAVLALAGVQIVPGEVTRTVDAAGQHAESSTEGMGIIVNPLKAVKPLVSVVLVPAGTAVRAAPVAQPEPDAPPVANRPRPEPLPRTGGELPYAVVAGAVLVTSAALLRRRRSRA